MMTAGSVHMAVRNFLFTGITHRFHAYIKGQ